MPDYQPGDIILHGTYRIEKAIGEGAFGKVYLATYLELVIPRAIKVVKKGAGLGSSEFLQYRDRFKLEAKLGAEFHHSNIIHVDQFEDEKNELFLIMDYAPGGSLVDQIKESQQSGVPIPVEQAVKWTIEAAEGLSKLHERDVVHRDVKPANILLDAEGHACIADLGLVQLPESRTGGSSGGINHPGTPEYMPPEQQPGNYMPLRASADIYALGCVLFELLTNKEYYHRSEGTKVTEIRPEVPTWLDDLVTKMLSPEAKKRPETAHDVVHLLKNERTGIQLKSWWIGLAILAILGMGAVIFRSIQPPGGVPKTQTSINSEAFNPIATVTTAPSMILSNTSVSEVSTLLPTSTVLSIGSTRISSKDGMEMMYVPAGNFTMGADVENINGIVDDPPHEIYLDDYWIDRTEVTNQMYQLCVDSNGCTPPGASQTYTRKDYYGNKEYDKFPVVFVDWNDAEKYCQWAGEDLPSEAQWEKAAKGTDTRIYPWGSQNVSGLLANFADKNTNFKQADKTIDDGYKDTSPVGNYPQGASPYKVLDMAGNVWEWVKDWYGEDYYQNSPSSNPSGPIKGLYRVLRGGSYGDSAQTLQVSFRYWRSPDLKDEFIGFRCVLNNISY